MKYNFRNLLSSLSLLTICAALLVLQACGSKNSDPAPTPSDNAKTQLSANSWKAVAVTVDGTTDQTAVFKNFVLTFKDNTFTSTNGGVVWPASGTFTFIGDDGKSFKRNDNIPVTIDALNDTGLILSLTWASTTLGGGRTNSIAGKYTFIFNK
jgi:hypothetical protein